MAALIGPVLTGLSTAGTVLNTVGLAAGAANSIKDSLGQLGRRAGRASSRPTRANIRALNQSAHNLKRVSDRGRRSKPRKSSKKHR